MLNPNKKNLKKTPRKRISLENQGFIEEELNLPKDVQEKETDRTEVTDSAEFDNHQTQRTDDDEDNEKNMDIEIQTIENGSEIIENEEKKQIKKYKKGIIYISNIPKHMNVMKIREILGQYGDIGRIYLQRENTSNSGDKPVKKKKRIVLHYTEGWVEFKSKRIAKKIPEFLNNTQIGTRKKSKFYDSLWSIKYLPRFKWIHLSERLNYEQAVYKQRLMTEISQARKETTFFQNNLDKSEFIKKKEKRSKKIKLESE